MLNKNPGQKKKIQFGSPGFRGIFVLKKILIVATVFLLLLFPIPACAEAFVSETIYLENDEYITISSKEGIWKIDCRCYPQFYFDSTESKQGLLKNGKTIYFLTDSTFELENGITPVCQNGSVEMQMGVTRKADDNIHALHIDHIVNDGTQPLTIRFLFTLI